jgi:hypothetical protein
VQQKLLTFITAHKFTQPCSILSLNNDTMGAPIAAEPSYLYHSTWVHLFKDKIEQGWVNSCAVIKVRSFCCTRGTHRVTVQRQALNSDTMGASSAAETSYLYHSTWVHSVLFKVSAALEASIVSLFKDKIEQGWVNSCAVIKVRSFCCTRGTHRVRCVPLVQQKLLTFMRAHEFTQPCSILSLNSDVSAALGAPIVELFKDKIEQGWVNWCAVIKVRSFCCTRGTHRVTVQRQDWTSLSELMCSDKCKKFLLNDGCP